MIPRFYPVLKIDLWRWEWLSLFGKNTGEAMQQLQYLVSLCGRNILAQPKPLHHFFFSFPPFSLLLLSLFLFSPLISPFFFHFRFQLAFHFVRFFDFEHFEFRLSWTKINFAIRDVRDRRPYDSPFDSLYRSGRHPLIIMQFCFNHDVTPIWQVDL